MALEEVPEEIEVEVKVEVEVGEARAFYFDKGAQEFKKHLAKKGFVEDRGFKKLVSPFKDEIKKRGWEIVSQHMEPSRRTLVKEFYANLGERKNLTCYVRGRWVHFGEKVISQLSKLRPIGDCMEYEQLQESPRFEKITQEMTNGLGQWQMTKTIRNAYINMGGLTEANRVWFYFINYVFTPLKHV